MVLNKSALTYVQLDSYFFPEPDSGVSTILTFTAPHDGKTAQVKHLDTLASQTHNSGSSCFRKRCCFQQQRKK